MINTIGLILISIVCIIDLKKTNDLDKRLKEEEENINFY